MYHYERAYLNNITAEDVRLHSLTGSSPQPVIWRNTYLMHLNNPSINDWACPDCGDVHRTDIKDTPWRRNRHRCINGPSYLDNPLHIRDDNKVHFSIQHRHVQLAIKYTRAEAGGHRAFVRQKHVDHLQRLLRPQAVDLTYVDSRGRLSEVRLTTFPKVVDGRFMLLSVFNHTFVPGGSEVRDVSWILRRLCTHSEPSDHLSRIIREAHRFNGTKYHDACDWCPTEFGITIWGERLTIRVWNDLGPEFSHPVGSKWGINTELPGPHKCKLEEAYHEDPTIDIKLRYNFPGRDYRIGGWRDWFRSLIGRGVIMNTEDGEFEDTEDGEVDPCDMPVSKWLWEVNEKDDMLDTDDQTLVDHRF